MRTHSKLRTVIAAFFALLAIAASTAPQLPNTPAGRRFSAWLTAFNSGDRTVYKRYLQHYNPTRVKDLDDDMNFRAMTGGFDVRKIERSTPTALSILIQERNSDMFARARMTVRSTPPYAMVNSDIQLAERPPEFALPHLTQQQLLSGLEPRLQQQVARGQFAGAVLIAQNGTPVFERAYGLADRSTNAPNTLGTRFRIGSMNKMITATAIMQLVQSGKIGLDAPFGTYLTDYPNKSVSAAVTIRELLTHTGGTGDIFGPKFFKNRLKLRTLQDYIDLYGKRNLLFKPGSKFDYSNYGFVLLGAVIEKVTGQSYYDYVHDRIYVRAGMTSTGSEPEDAVVPNRSIGYTLAPKGNWVPNTDTLPYRPTSAGGGYTTVGDLLRFANALQNNTLLNQTYKTMMTTGTEAMGGGLKYGFGFADQVINGTRCFGHNGGAPGMNGDLEICDDGYTVVVLSNLDPPAASRVADFITNRLPLRSQ